MNKTKLIYRYMNINVKDKREQALKIFFDNKEYDKNLDFLDLDIYKKDLTLNDKIRREIFKSKLDDKIFLTKYQVEILEVFSENNLFLSAPTSFGKTFIMLEYLKRNSNLKNIVFIIPTLALMNELLRKIFNFFGDDYNICINSDEAIEERNIFIFVPERSDDIFINIIDSIEIDLLIFDEIYKLQGSAREIKTDDRLIYMNKVYLDLVTRAKKIALLGPYINSVEFDNTKLDIVKYFTNYMPVYNDLEFLDEDTPWTSCIKLQSELIYFKSPSSIYNNIDLVLKKIPENDIYINLYSKEIAHLQTINHDSWYVVDLLKRGIGIHHGKTPMFLRKFYENEYNSGRLRTLLCTNTLMEGINTPTESLIIVDDPGNTFKFNNLVGRVGRLNTTSPVKGKVYVSDANILTYINSNDDWLDLTILAEDKKVHSSNEVLYLKKEYKDNEKKEIFEKKLSFIEIKTKVSKEDLINHNVDFDKTFKFVEKDFSMKFRESKSIYDCVVLTVNLIPGVHYDFQVKNYKNLDTDFNYLKYKVYINRIIAGAKFSEIINDFNLEYNKSYDIENINKFIDALYNLKNYIKFKFTKVLNYLELFDLTNANEFVVKFISRLRSFSESVVMNKILDDLGIEDSDVKPLSSILSLDDKISASRVIKEIRLKKDKININELSPFTINNLKNI